MKTLLLLLCALLFVLPSALAQETAAKPTKQHRVTPFGLRAALFFTRAHARLYRPSVTQCSTKDPPHNSRLALQFHKLENTIHTYVQEANLAA